MILRPRTSARHFICHLKSVLPSSIAFTRTFGPCGCIMYELCAKEPPFNAKTHLELIQRIRLGRITPLSHIYSTELKDSIAKCLRVNPLHRPDTVQLLNIPMVKLKRKELEIVRVGRHLKTKEEHAARLMKDAERRTAQLDSDKVATRMELDQAVRREWEVKARLEIDRQVQAEMERLYQGFEEEVSRRVAEEIKKIQPPAPREPVRRSTSPLGDVLPQDVPLPGHQQSQSTTGETDDFPSSTDLSELSLESPTLNKSREGRKTGRTPFARAQTMFEGSPMDVAMADPSPAQIASLNLSPRRNGAQPSSLGRNIFAAAEQQRTSPTFPDDGFGEDDENEDTDELPPLPSPTRARANNGDPFKVHNARRPAMLRQKTAPQNKASAPNLFGRTAAPKPSNNVKENSHPSLTHAPSLPKPSTHTSPGRRISKLPSASNILADAGSPQRKTKNPSTSPTRHNSQISRLPPSGRKGDADDIRHAAMLNSAVQGRTLVELAQARGTSSNGAGVAVQDFGGAEAGKDGRYGRDVGDAVTDPTNVTVWDPERDEMPSPFLVRHGRGVLSGGAAGGPGMRHLR